MTRALALILALAAGEARAACTSCSSLNWTGNVDQVWEPETQGTRSGAMQATAAYIYSPNTGTWGSCAFNGCWSVTFTVSVTGDYKVEGLVNARNTNTDRFYFQMLLGGSGVNDCAADSGRAIWDIDSGAGNTFVWRYVTDNNNSNSAANARTFRLTAATVYTLWFAGRDDDVLLEKVRLMRDPCLAAPTPTPVPTVAGSGTGLCGLYYPNSTLSGSPAYNRAVDRPAYDWGTGSPGAPLPADVFSVKWIGRIEFPVSGFYTLCAYVDDGAQIWVDGTLLGCAAPPACAFWADHSGVTLCAGAANYSQGQHDLVFNYYENTGNALVHLVWSGPGIPQEDLPLDRLYPDPYCGAATPTMTPSATPPPTPVAQGLAASQRLYELEYIPMLSPSNLPDLAVTFSTAVLNSVPKNTARWRIEFTGLTYTVGSQVGVETRIGPHGVTCSTGNYNYSDWASAASLTLPARPQNLSTTYMWLDGAPVPYTERFDAMGDPRHVPYIDALASGDYNWFFKDLRDAAQPDYRAAYPSLAPLADCNRYNDQPAVDVPKLFMLWRLAITASRSIYTSMTGYSSYYIGAGAEIGGDAANKLTGGVNMSNAPWGAGGSADHDEITGAVSLVRNTANTWRSLPFLGELWPDSAYAGDWSSALSAVPFGNLRNSGGGGGSWRRDARENCDNGAFSFLQARHRTSEEGCGSFMNGSSGGSSFNHYYQSLNASLAADGRAINDSYHFPMPSQFNVNRPWGLNAGNTQVEWGLAPYSASRHSLSTYSASTQSASATGFYLRDGTVNATDRSSAAIRSENTAAAAAGWFIINGLQPSTDSGINFVAEFALLSCLRTFHDAGAPTAAASGWTNLKNKVGANTYRIEPVPMVEITLPNQTTDTRGLGVIPVVWKERFTRWDSRRYSENYPCLDADDGQVSTSGPCSAAVADAPGNPDLEWHSEEALAYNLKYSENNGATWWTVLPPSLTCTPGVFLDAPYAMSFPGGTHTFTYLWDVASLPVGNKRFRVEVYRSNIKQHYAYHDIAVFTNP